MSGDLNVGGLVGCVNSEDVVRDPSFSDIIKSYASGTVSGSKHVGGLVGNNYGRVEYSHSIGNVKGETYVGGLVGFNSYYVEDCYAAGLTEGKVNIGGLVGFNDAYVMSSNASGTTEGETYVGGLVGFNYGLVEYCYADTNVFAKTYVGGLVGYNDGTREGSYASGNVMGEDFVGGLVGYNIYEVTDSYATGTVFGSIAVGGLVGINKDQVTNCYAIGLVYGGTVQGGLIGINDGGVTSSYYDKETSGQSDTGKGEPKTTAEMKLRSTYQDWNFEYVWSIRDGETYPMFYWQEEAPQSSFVVEIENIGALSGMAFNLYINYARGEDGELLNGFYRVKVDSDLDGENVVNEEFIFIDGETTVPVTLDAVGIHKLRIYVTRISFSNVVEINKKVISVTTESDSSLLPKVLEM